MRKEYRTYLNAFSVTSLPMVILSFLYGGHAIVIYFIAFILGMMFQGRITPLKLVVIIKNDLKREIKKWKQCLKKMLNFTR